MIISCENCDTKYRLDASRLSHASVKVQCSKCDHIFIVPAAGEERKKQGLEVSPPHEDKQTEGSNQPPAEPEPRQGEADETAVSHEHEEQSAEEDKTGDSDDTAGASAADFSFPAETKAPEPTQDETAEPPIEAAAEKDAPEHEAKADPEPEETGPQEVSDDSAEAAGPVNKDKKEAPLPWEVNANTFDLSFGAEGHKAQGEAEAGNAEAETTDEKKPEPHGDLNNAPEATEHLGEKNKDKEEGQGIEAPPETRDFDLKSLIEEPDDSHAASNGVKEGAPSFTEELLKAVSDDDKTPGATEQEAPGKAEAEVEAEDSAQQNNTFVIPSDISSEPEPQETKKSGIGGIIAIFVIVLAIAGGLIYMKSRPDSVLMNEPSLAKSIEIESTKGYYVVNKEGGRIFVIETLLKNVTDGPVKISGIRGLVMDSSGREMAHKMVSPGRIVTAKDLRNLPVETLLKSFSDTSEGTMPKKSTIPTMILFTNLQKAVAEYGIDVLR